MDELTLLKPNLIRLKLSGILESLEGRIEQALSEKWEYTHFLLTLLSDEVERRDNKQLIRRISRSGLDPEKTFVTFDFSFNPKIHEPTFKELATCSFIEKKQNIFLVGPSGVGKTHLAQALGHEACLRGYDVVYRNTYTLFKWLYAGRADDSHDRRMAQVRSIPLLLIDDFGLRDLNDYQQADLYELISVRYEKYPMIITSNRDFNEWPQVFSNPLMGSAAMDRLVHRAIKLVIEGKSYRLNTFIQTAKDLTKMSKEST
jgi:DNA replication protein DnaC